MISKLHSFINTVAVNTSGINLPHASADSASIQNILQIVFGVAGALAILFIVIAGFMYITSSGEPQKVSKAKNAIIYSVVGLIVCILAEVIVTFVIGQL